MLTTHRTLLNFSKRFALAALLFAVAAVAAVGMFALPAWAKADLRPTINYYYDAEKTKPASTSDVAACGITFTLKGTGEGYQLRSGFINSVDFLMGKNTIICNKTAEDGISVTYGDKVGWMCSFGGGVSSGNSPVTQTGNNASFNYDNSNIYMVDITITVTGIPAVSGSSTDPGSSMPGGSGAMPGGSGPSQTPQTPIYPQQPQQPVYPTDPGQPGQPQQSGFTVHYEANASDATGSMSDQKFDILVSPENPEGTAYLTANAFTREGYTFKCWNTKADGSGTSYTNGQRISINDMKVGATLTLYAQWEKKQIITATQGGSINLPKTGTKYVTIPSGVTSFKVYDDGGPSNNYSSGCDGSLLLTAPDGYTLKVSGNARLAPDPRENYLSVYDGDWPDATLLGKYCTSFLDYMQGKDCDIGQFCSTGKQMLIYLYSQGGSGAPTTKEDGLDLTVEVIALADFNVTVVQNGGVCMPTASRRNVTIPSGVTSFYVFDDGGKDSNYSKGCDGYMLLTAPEGCVLKVSGSVITALNSYAFTLGIPADYLSIYDGDSKSATEMLKFSSYTSDGVFVGNNNIEPQFSSGRQMLLYFYSISESKRAAGLNLCVEVLKPGNTTHSITIASGITNGSVEADVTTAVENKKVTLTAQPVDGYRLDTLTVAKANDANTKVSVGGYGNTRTFNMPDYDVTVTATFTLKEKVAAPTFSPAAGSYTGTQSVMISCATSGATIYYTTDGTPPTTSSPVYNKTITLGNHENTITVSENTTLRALAVKDGMTDSDVASAAYTITAGQPDPVAPDDSGKTDSELTEEQKAVGEAKKRQEQETEQKAKEAEEAARTVDTRTPGGQTLADLMSGKNADVSKSQEEQQATQAAALEVKKELEKSGFDVSEMSAHEVKSAVKNKEQEKKDAVDEAAGKVEKTTVPAATDLLGKYSNNKDLKEANKEFSAQPKVVTPEVLSADSKTQAVENIKKTAIGEQKVAEGVDPDVVQAANREGLKTSDDITIEPADKDLTKQTEAVEKVFNEVSADLADANDGKGVVIVTVLPKMTPKVSGFFPLKVNLRHLLPGRRVRFWPSVEHFKRAQGKVSVSLASSGQEGDYFFLDENGVPTAVVSGDASKMTVVAYLEGGKPYEDAFITADATEADQAALKKLEETGSSGNGDPDAAPTSPTSDKGSGGCDAGFGAASLAMFTFAALIASRKH